METRQRVGFMLPCLIAVVGGHSPGHPVCAVLPNCCHQECQGVTMEYVVSPCLSVPWSLIKTVGNDDNKQVIIISLPFFPLPSHLCLVLHSHSSHCLLPILSAVTWHTLSLSFGQAVDSDIAVLGHCWCHWGAVSWRG